MATAKLHDGKAIVAYIDGVAVDSNNVAIEGAPKQPKDTDPSEQPHAMAGLNTEERSAAVLANALASAMKGGGKPAKESAKEQAQPRAESEAPKVPDPNPPVDPYNRWNPVQQPGDASAQPDGSAGKAARKGGARKSARKSTRSK